MRIKGKRRDGGFLLGTLGSRRVNEWVEYAYEYSDKTLPVQVLGRIHVALVVEPEAEAALLRVIAALLVAQIEGVTGGEVETKDVQPDPEPLKH